MKRIALALVAALFATSAIASMYCGLPPLAPPGCKYLCVCDNYGQNCRWILIC